MIVREIAKGRRLCLYCLDKALMATYSKQYHGAATKQFKTSL